MSDQMDAVKDSLRREADRAYCQFIDKMSSRECLGEEAKLRDGRFGAAELDAHRDARELLGVHRGIYKAIAAMSEAQAAEATDRTRFESQIKHYDTTFGGEFEDALTKCAFRNGLSWFTDDQIADIRAVMVQSEWDRRVQRARSRASYARKRAALNSLPEYPEGYF